MKKIIILLLIFNIQTVNAKTEVTLQRCVDGDTAWFMIDQNPKKVRFLAIDTPESTNKIEYLGVEASNYTCSELKKGMKIELEFDDNSSKEDKYGRLLAWIFVDDFLLQQKIIEKGLGKVDYLYGNYKYTSSLISSENIAKKQRLGIWNTESNYLYDFLLFAIFIIIIIFLIYKKRYKKAIRILKKIKR